jgi:formate/nitrite transporter
VKLLALGFMAGTFVALASNGSTMAAHNLLLRPETYGLGRTIGGAIFGAALMLVVVAGGELFTGNTLMVMGLLDKKITLGAMLRNWCLVYVGNFIGSLFIAALAVYSGSLHASANDFGGMTIRIAASKTALGFGQAVALGVLCNMLVCGGVWMAYGAKDIGGKLLACFFSIWLFATSGFEHSVANMFYIPAGIWAAADHEWLEAAKLSGSALAGLNWANFFARNLLPVTIGNIIGGSCLIGGVYWFCYMRSSAKKTTANKAPASSARRKGR